MSFWSQISPRGAVEDLVHEWRRPNPYRWRILGVSVAATFTLMVIVIPDSERAEPRPPTVTWISTFRPDRTDEEIIASNLENQKYKDKLKAEAEARAERKRQAARALARASGFDPDELARQYGDTPAPASRPAQPAPKPAPATGER
ncbi:MAG TPA: hypothetical protein VFS49_02660 [Croceibacterium sp.]|nr:hypothetical protein [Croceibacterium sp.]